MSAPTAVAAPDDMPPGTWRTLAQATYGVGAMGAVKGEAVRLPAGAEVLVQRDQDHRVEIAGLPGTVILAAFLDAEETTPVTNWFVAASALRFAEPR